MEVLACKVALRFVLLLLVIIMTSCRSFMLPYTIVQRANSLHNDKGPVDSEFPPPDAATPNNDDEQSSSQSPLGIDEEFIPFPHADYTANDVVKMCMDTLSHNNDPYRNAGLEVCWNFSSDRCRAAKGGSLEAFIQNTINPIFGSMVDALEWHVVSTGPVIEGTPTRGAMQTVLVEVQPQAGDERRFLWTLQQERRPPRQGCWLVWECLSVDYAFVQTE